MKIIELTWEDVIARIEYVKKKNKIKSNTKIYGVPKNGMIIASFFGCVSVYEPEKAEFILDDIVDSGGTLCNAAKAILDANALTVRAYITHGVLSDDACQKVEKSVLEELVITDSIPDRCPKNCKKTRQVSVSQLFGEAIRRVTNEESVSSLFS